MRLRQSVSLTCLRTHASLTCRSCSDRLDPSRVSTWPRTRSPARARSVSKVIVPALSEMFDQDGQFVECFKHPWEAVAVAVTLPTPNRCMHTPTEKLDLEWSLYFQGFSSEMCSLLWTCMWLPVRDFFVLYFVMSTWYFCFIQFSLSHTLLYCKRMANLVEVD